MKRKELIEHSFEELGLAPKLLKRVDALGFVHPTPIQHKAIPVAIEGEDVLGIAQTGSGKTLAFSLPMLQQISRQKKTGLVLLPTRELAVQVQETLNKVAGPIGLRTALLIGGTNANPQKKQLKKNPHIIVATPGRLIDMTEQKFAKLDNVGVLVLDEADRMLDMGFAPQLKRIMGFLPEDRQTMLFSATMPEEIVKMTRQYMKAPVRVEVARPGTTADKIDQEVFIVPKAEKMQLLEKLLNEHEGTTLVFSRTKHGAKKIARVLRKLGFTADEIHSNRSQAQRQKALKGFDKGKYRILVATDIAARGIDVSHIKLVINYDLPDQLDDYVHRIGRTGRAGREGKAISFAAPEQKRDVAKIQELINVILPVKAPTGEDLDPIVMLPRKSRSGGGGRGRARGHGRGNGNGRRRSGGGGGRSRSGGRKRAFTSRNNNSNKKKRSGGSRGRGR